MRFVRQSLIGLFLMALTIGCLAYAALTVRDAMADRMNREGGKPQARERVFTVNVMPAVPETVIPVFTAFGEIASQRSLELRATTGGRVVERADVFEDGLGVMAGETLLRIDPANALSALARAKADLSDAKAEVGEADRAFILARDELTAAQERADLRDRALTRQQDLQRRGVGTAAAVEAAELSFSAAKATVLSRRQALAQAEARKDQAATRMTRAEIALNEAQRNLDDTVITAGFDGVLTGVNVIEGGIVTQNERLGEIIDPDALEVSFRIPTQSYARLLDNRGKLIRAPVQVTLDVFGIDITTNGSISRESAAVGEGQTGRLIFARLENPRGFKPGDFVTVQVEEPELERVVRLPSAAYGADGAVLALDEDDRLQSIPVTLLRRQGDAVLVRGQGLWDREVVMERSPALGVGIKVKPMRPGGDASAEPEDIELSVERRAKLVAFVEGNKRMPDDVRRRILNQLSQDRVPVRVVNRLENRMGG